jgi:hypothetical protein
MKATRKLKPLSETDKKALYLLQKKGNCTRLALQVALFGTKNNASNDRKVRRSIQNLRNHNFVIISSSRTSDGYQLTTDKTKVKFYVDEQFKKAKAMMAIARKVARAHGLRHQTRMSV